MLFLKENCKMQLINDTIKLYIQAYLLKEKAVMRKKIRALTKELKQANGAHILYEFANIEKYIDNAVTYVLGGIEQGDHVLILENDKLYPLIHKKLIHLLGQVEMDKVHRVNNFDFYTLQGNFNPNAKTKYLYKYLKPYVEQNISIRTWTHVEWGDQKKVIDDLKDYKEQMESKPYNLGLTSIFAYNTERLTPLIKEYLIKCHDVLMLDDTITYIK